MAKRFGSHLFFRLALATALLILTSFPVLSIIVRCHDCHSDQLRKFTMGTNQCTSGVHCYGHNTLKRQCTKVVPARFARCSECGNLFPTNPTETCNTDHTIPCDRHCPNVNPSNYHMADVMNGNPANNHGITRCHLCQSDQLHKITMGMNQCTSGVYCFVHNTLKRQCTEVVPAIFAQCSECGNLSPTNPTETCNNDHTIPCDRHCPNVNPSNHHMADVINVNPPTHQMAAADVIDLPPVDLNEMPHCNPSSSDRDEDAHYHHHHYYYYYDNNK